MQQFVDFRSTGVKKLWPYYTLAFVLLLCGVVQVGTVMLPYFSTMSSSSSSFSKIEGPNTTNNPSVENSPYYQTKGRIFHCGYKWPIARLFPDYYDSRESLQWNPNEIHPNSTEHDILVYGMHGPCPSRNIERILRDEFFGNVLYINGEPNGNVFDMIPNEWILDPKNHPEVYRLFQIGPYPPIKLSSMEQRTTTDMSALFKQQHIHFYNQQSLQVFHMTLYLSKEVVIREDTNSMDRTIGKSTNQDQHYDIITSNTPLWQLLSDHTKKARNTREYSAIVYLATNCQAHRQEAAQQLSTVVPVHYGETCTVSGFNNSQIPLSILTSRSKFQQNDRIFRHYKYCLVMENNRQVGYMTEKLLNAYLGGCLPIYYGTSEVLQIFHPNSFVFYDVIKPNPALQLIQLLEANDTLYEEMLYSTPILLNGEETLDQFFSLLPEMANGRLNRKLREMMGIGELLLPL